MAEFWFEPLSADDGVAPSNLTTTQPWAGLTPVVDDGSPPQLTMGNGSSTASNRLCAFTHFGGVAVGSPVDPKIYATITPSGSSNSSMVALYCDTGAASASAEGYFLGLNRAQGEIQIVKCDGFSRSTLASAVDSGNFRTVHILAEAEVDGSSLILRVKVWDQGDTEPGTWTLEHTDSSPYSAGAVGYAQTDSTGATFDVGVFNFGLGTGGDAAPRSAPSADETAPTLSSPTGTQTGQTTADLSVSTNEGNGTLYWIVSESATPPSVAQIQAGNDSTGSAAADSGNQAVSGTGTQNANATGLTAGTTYYAYFQHIDAADNDSAVSASSSFATASAVATVTVTDPLKNNTGTVLASETGVAASVLDATTLASVYEATGLTTNGSGVLEAISNAAITASSSYHVAIKMADGSVGITGPITAT